MIVFAPRVCRHRYFFVVCIMVRAALVERRRRSLTESWFSYHLSRTTKIEFVHYLATTRGNMLVKSGWCFPLFAGRCTLSPKSVLRVCQNGESYTC